MVVSRPLIVLSIRQIGKIADGDTETELIKPLMVCKSKFESALTDAGENGTFWPVYFALGAVSSPRLHRLNLKIYILKATT